MATDSGGNRLDEVKSQFTVREGTYKLSGPSEYSRPNRGNYADAGNIPVSVSFSFPGARMDIQQRICFSIGKELYVYPYKGLRKAADLTQPTDKRMYKGTFPTCHSFSELDPSETEEKLLLLVGFSAGQVQLIDPICHETSLLFNQERSIDKTKVTCVSWLPNNTRQFIVSHASGSLYVYSVDYQCSPIPPNYQIFKQADSHVVFTCKTKSSRNPMFKWVIGDGAIYQFKFSPCKQYLAVVSQDGYLRVFDFNRMELLGYMKSYFGGLHCVSWSSDGKYLATGGEDDLITVYSFHENRVICRGRGHKSWVTSIAFDSFTTSASQNDCADCPSDDESTGLTPITSKSSLRESTRSSNSSRVSIRLDCDGHVIPLTTYRIGSVSQDTNLCLWDITTDVLNSHIYRNRSSSHVLGRMSALEINTSLTTDSSLGSTKQNHAGGGTSSNSAPNIPSLPSPSVLSLGNGVKAKRNFTLSYKDKHSVRSNNAATQLMKNSLEHQRLLGTQHCPRLDDTPVLEPLTCKKLAHSMLTTINFFEDYIVTSCQEGVVSCFARPHKQLIGSKSTDSSDVQLANRVVKSSSLPSTSVTSQHSNSAEAGLHRTINGQW